MNMRIEQTTMLSNPPVRLTRYDPNKKCFVRPTDTVNFLPGGQDNLDFLATDFIWRTVTALTQESLFERTNHFISTHGTATKLNSSMWSKIPTITDYLEKEELYDLEETENAFYQATTQQGW